MAKYLVIVESPAKAKTLKKFLGANYKIDASVGHVRDLPKSYLGIDVEKDFAMKYITIRGKKDVITNLKKDVKNVDFVYLATDPDREGEAIAWHLFELLHLNPNKTKRITFNEITKTAVKNSIKNARDIDMNLVNAQQARRALDRIVGYKISPILWHKIRGGLSAGRVQSVALKMICDREKERVQFVAQEYWSIDVSLKFKREKFVAKFYGDINDKIELKSKEDTDKILSFIEENEDKFIVDEVKKGSRVSKPYPPFTTSTLQQEASKILGFQTSKTMRVAQQLYEGIKIDGEGTVGLISYIRTDSVRISDEAYMQAKEFILEQYGENYLASSRPIYKSKGNAQDAHEAIRPTYSSRTPELVKSSLTTEQYKLYKLIWQRFIASQMAPANYDTQTVKILNGKYVFKSTGSILKFNGYLIVYDSEKEKNVKIPSLTQGDKMQFEKSIPQQHFTQPPARFTEAMLVKTLEELGIGRPSTYSAIITNIQNRSYVAKESKAFYPTELGEIVNDLLCENFNQIVNINFTSDMELSLDKVEDGRINWISVLKDFYFPFNKTVEIAESKIDKVEIKDEPTDVICDKCGRNMVIKIGRYGKFLACPGFPECKNAKPIFEEIETNCPKCGSKIFAKKTRRGKKYYVCEKNPECSFISWDKPLNEKCTKCGSFMIEKGKKKVCSNKDCS